MKIDTNKTLAKFCEDLDVSLWKGMEFLKYFRTKMLEEVYKKKVTDIIHKSDLMRKNNIKVIPSKYLDQLDKIGEAIIKELLQENI